MEKLTEPIGTRTRSFALLPNSRPLRLRDHNAPLVF